MERESIYLQYLIGDLENFVITTKTEIEKLVSSKDKISVEESVYIFDKFSKSLKKITDLIKFSKEVEDKEILRTISIVSSETIAWIMFTLPNVEPVIPVFVENLILNDIHIIDALGELLLVFDEFIEDPSRLKNLNSEFFEMINEISMFFGHLSQIMKKGATEN